jgi:hypothetical protein
MNRRFEAIEKAGVNTGRESELSPVEQFLLF